MTLLCLPLSRVRKEYLLQRRFFLQPKQPACCPGETILNGPLFKLSPYADLLSGEASDSTSVDHTASPGSDFFNGLRKLHTAVLAPSSNPRFLREEGTVVIIQTVIQPHVLYRTSHNLQSATQAPRAGLQGKHVLGSFSGQD